MLDFGREVVFDDNGRPPSAQINDPDEWYAANPLLGLRISEEQLRDELAADLTRTGGRMFAIDRLGAWAAGAEERTSPIPLAAWEARVYRGEPVDIDALTFTYAVDAFAGVWSVARAARFPDGTVGVQIVASLAGDPAAALEVLEREVGGCKVLGDLHGQMAEFEPELKRLPGWTEVPASDITAAWGRFKADVAEGRLWHPDDVRLNASVAGAVERAIGERTVISRAASAPNMPVVMSAALAAWGINSAPTGTPSVLVM